MSARAYWKSFAVVHALAAAIIGVVLLIHPSWPLMAGGIWATGSLLGLIAYWRGVHDERRRTR